jgi:O-acetyl-ADP-ribose deacetylase (regulator of RNase III)
MKPALPPVSADDITSDVKSQLMTDKGLAAEITAKSTKYYKDDDLN